ncbi:MAG: hypothetical protein U0992_02725 [Planctomycetaceae bacterium]
MVDFVAGVVEGREHVLIGDPPAAAEEVEVVLAVLEEDAQRLVFGLADQGGEVVATTERDERADRADDAAELVRTLPGDVERADRSRAGAGDGTVVRVGAELVRFADFGEEFFDEEPGVLVAEAVVLKAAIEAAEGVLIGGRDDAGADKDADLNRDVLLVDEVVEGGGELPVLGAGNPVLDDEDSSRLAGVVLGGDVDPVVADGTGEDVAFERNGTFDFSLRNAGLGDRIRCSGRTFPGSAAMENIVTTASASEGEPGTGPKHN